MSEWAITSTDITRTGAHVRRREVSRGRITTLRALLKGSPAEVVCSSSLLFRDFLLLVLDKTTIEQAPLYFLEQKTRFRRALIISVCSTSLPPSKVRKVQFYHKFSFINVWCRIIFFGNLGSYEFLKIAARMRASVRQTN